MKRSLFASLLVLGAASSAAQVGLPSHDGTPSVATGSVPLTYTGGDTRASVGVDQDGNTQGELAQVFGNNGEHAIVAQLWWGHGGAGGIQADYNWLFGTTLEQARKDPDSVTVAKLSFAIDQNAEKARQANVGLSIERKEFFLNFFLSGKASGAHDAGAATTQQQQTLTGSDDTGTYTQTRTDVATTVLLSQPYSYTVGVHGGHFSDALTARFNGGFDYARGNQGANEKRISVSVDKYLGTRGWSVSGIAEHAQSTPVIGAGTSDNRWWLFVRYEFGGGGAFRPYADAGAASAAWIDRALHQPVTGHARNVQTYVTRGNTTTTSTFAPKQYTARFPIARDDTASVGAGSAGVDIDVLANDTDPDNGMLTISAAGPASHGDVQIVGTRVRYTPAAGYSGSDAFAYTITGSKGLTASAKVHVTVTPELPPPGGGAPVARDDATTTPFGQPVTVNVLGNDSDPSGYPLAVVAATQPVHGSAHINPDNTITYTPGPGFSGSDHFAYTIDNAHGGTASATVTIVVQPAPPPVAVDDTATTGPGSPVDIDVLANDSDPAGYALSVVSVGTPANGTTKIVNGGLVRYTPGVEFTGTDQFSYTISDGHGQFASANVTVTVLSYSTTLFAGSDDATTPYATPVTINVLANDYGPPGKTLSIKSVTAPVHGTATITSGGIRYVPDANFFGGTDTFTYTVGDGSEATSANVTVKVLPPAPPIAQNDSATTGVGTPVTITVLANDSDPAGFALHVTAIPTPPAHGSAVINGDNTITYTPQPTYLGNDSFSYTISDGHGTATAQVAVTVQAPIPIANADSATIAFNPAAAMPIAVLGNDSDPSNLPLTITQVTQGAHGAVTFDATKVYYLPGLAIPPYGNTLGPYAGGDSFSYTISNGTKTATATVTVNVQFPPRVSGVDFGVQCVSDGSACHVCLSDNISNTAEIPYTLTVQQPTLAPTSAVNPPAEFGSCAQDVIYSIDTGAAASDAFTYTLADVYHATPSISTVSVTVVP